MIGIETKPQLNWYVLVLSVLALSLIITSNAVAWEDNEFTPDHLRSDRSVWNSGAIDALNGSPIGFDGSDDYILEYTEARERIRQEELTEAIENLHEE